MTVTVLLFASYADALGTGSIQVEVAPGATVADIVSHVRSLPGASRLPDQPLLAVNETYSSKDRVVMANDLVAIIPPVAGG